MSNALSILLLKQVVVFMVPAFVFINEDIKFCIHASKRKGEKSCKLFSVYDNFLSVRNCSEHKLFLDFD